MPHRSSFLVIVAAMLLGAVPAAASARVLERTFKLGPVALAPYESKIRYMKIPAPRVDGFITRMHARVIDPHGRFVPQQRVMLHNIVFKSLDRRVPYCGGTTTQSFYGTGEENETLRLPAGYGYRVRRSDRWAAGWMLMNHRWWSRKVYIQWTVRIDTDRHTTPVDPNWVNVACHRDPIFNVPGGQRADGLRLAAPRRPRAVLLALPRARPLPAPLLAAPAGHERGDRRPAPVTAPGGC